jgi:hypothetical protein
LVGLVNLISFQAFAQLEPNTTPKKIDNEISPATNTGQFKTNTGTSKVAPNSNIDLTINNSLNTNAINNNLQKYSANTNNGNFLLETLPEDRDIIGKRYLNNEDVTHKRLHSSMSLGTVNTSSKTVRVECRDYSYVDGDIIKIYINERPLENNIVLKGGNYVVYLDLNEGYNRIDFQALNQGLSGPNTAELRLYDANDNLISAKEWNLLTGQTATLGVIRKQ